MRNHVEHDQVYTASAINHKQGDGYGGTRK